VYDVERAIGEMADEDSERSKASHAVEEGGGGESVGLSLFILWTTVKETRYHQAEELAQKSARMPNRQP
jgi:hypothetical protein